MATGQGEYRALQRLDLNLLRVFQAIDQERNLTRAARVLNLSQSAVSHALGRLRQALNDDLFVREGRGVAPTALSARLAPDIRAALDILQRSLRQDRDFDPARDVPQFTIAVNDELEPLLLPPVVRRLAATAPDIRVASVRFERRSLKTDLAAGRLDLAVDVAQPTRAEISHAPLIRDGFCVVAARRRRLTEASYLRARHVTVSSRRTGYSMEDWLLAGRGYQRDVVMRCQHYEAACRVVADSELLLTMPRRHANALNQALGGRLALMPVPLPVPEYELHLYWDRQRDQDAGNRWLREQILALAGEKGVF